MRSHHCVSPLRHAGQRWQTIMPSQTTRSPTVTDATFAPTSTTVPAHSWPGMTGKRTHRGSVKTPVIISMSVRHRPAARLWTRTSPGPTAGACTSGRRPRWVPRRRPPACRNYSTSGERHRRSREPLLVALHRRAHRRARPPRPSSSRRCLPSSPRCARACASRGRSIRSSAARTPATTTTPRSGWVLEMLGSVPAGHVAVYQTNDPTSAHLGELSVTSLASRGCAGAVLDGGVRDAEYILREDFPVFARYVTPQDCVSRWELLAHGDVTIVVGGVPHRARRLDRRRPRRARDRAGRDGRRDPRRGRGEGRHRERDPRAVRGGTLPLEAYERYGTF